LGSGHDHPRFLKTVEATRDDRLQHCRAGIGVTLPSLLLVQI
jgi:hypothetical protein